MSSTTIALTRELANLVVSTLNLEKSATALDPTAPLFGDTGLGLDSIDILEIAVEISKQYGVQLRSDDAESPRIFSSLNTLAEYVAAHRRT